MTLAARGLKAVDGLLEEGGEQSDMVAVHEAVVHIHGHVDP